MGEGGVGPLIGGDRALHLDSKRRGIALVDIALLDIFFEERMWKKKKSFEYEMVNLLIFNVHNITSSNVHNSLFCEKVLY